MIEPALREIGLTKGEAKVYLSLLEIGITTTGKIIKKSQISASKVYYILEKLSQKGLVSTVIKQKTKYFQATSPQRILDYLSDKEKVLEEQKENIQKVLPLLLTKKQKSESEAEMYKGFGGIKTMFYSILNELQKGNEYFVIGAGWGFKEDSLVKEMLIKYHQERARKGIYAHLLYNFELYPSVDELKFKLCKIKPMPQELTTSTQIMIFNEKIFLILWKKEPLGFVIKDPELRDSFKKYFDVLWERDLQTLKGFEGVRVLCRTVLNEKKDFYLIGANGILYQNRPDYFVEFDKQRVKLGIKLYNLSLMESRNLAFNRVPNTEVRYLPPEFSSPLLIWIFGDYVANILWEKEEIIFLMKNKHIAEDYRKYFNYLWKKS